MVSVLNVVLFGAVLAGHTLIAAVMTRFFRIRLKTQWGYVVYSLLLVPIVLFVSTLVFFGVLPIGAGLNLDVSVLIGASVGMPLALGFAIDTLYVPPPEEYDLPETR